jgi:hypothetical protein
MTNIGSTVSQPLLNSSDFGIATEQLCDMFHPDNIKNPHPQDGRVSTSLYDYWKTFRGPQGLADLLQTNLKTGIDGSEADL